MTGGRTLFLVRHGKSSWDRPLDDHERPLAPRGRRAAPAMAAYMAANRLVPERVLCSTAVRARQTWEAMAPTLGPHIPVTFHEEIYLQDAPGILSLIRSAGEGRSLMVVGHEPGLGELALHLVGRGAPGDGSSGARARLARKYPTAALAVLGVPGPWEGLDWGAASLERFVRPKDLPEADRLGL